MGEKKALTGGVIRSATLGVGPHAREKRGEKPGARALPGPSSLLLEKREWGAGPRSCRPREGRERGGGERAEQRDAACGPCGIGEVEGRRRPRQAGPTGPERGGVREKGWQSFLFTLFNFLASFFKYLSKGV